MLHNSVSVWTVLWSTASPCRVQGLTNHTHTCARRHTHTHTHLTIYYNNNNKDKNKLILGQFIFQTFLYKNRIPPIWTVHFKYKVAYRHFKWHNCSVLVTHIYKYTQWITIHIITDNYYFHTQSNTHIAVLTHYRSSKTSWLWHTPHFQQS